MDIVEAWRFVILQRPYSLLRFPSRRHGRVSEASIVYSLDWSIYLSLSHHIKDIIYSFFFTLLLVLLTYFVRIVSYMLSEYPVQSFSIFFFIFINSVYFVVQGFLYLLFDPTSSFMSILSFTGYFYLKLSSWVCFVDLIVFIQYNMSSGKYLFCIL